MPGGGLELPRCGQLDGEGWLESSEAGRLFIDRAMRAHPGFVIDDVGAVAVAQICQGLDGIPLALELAAARTQLMSVQAIAQGLSDRFRLLVGSGRAGPSRQRTLLASIEWSCDLLREEERTLLRRLSVFASGFTLSAAETVSAGGQIERDHVLGLLTSLVDKSLVQADAGADRFRLHETMRAYGCAAMEAEGGTAALRDRHVAYFTDLAKTMEAKWPTSELPVALATCEPDLDNLRAALDWDVESGRFDAGADLLEALGAFIFVLGLWPEGWARCQSAAGGRSRALAPGRAVVLSRFLRAELGPSASLRLASELIALGRSLGDDRTIVLGLCQAANMLAWAQPDDAVRTANEEMDLAIKAGLQRWVGLGLHNKAWAYFWLGRTEDALSLAEESMGIFRELDFSFGLVLARSVSSISATHSGRLGKGLEESETLLQLGNELPARHLPAGPSATALRPTCT